MKKRTLAENLIELRRTARLQGGQLIPYTQALEGALVELQERLEALEGAGCKAAAKKKTAAKKETVDG